MSSDDPWAPKLLSLIARSRSLAMLVDAHDYALNKPLSFASRDVEELRQP